MHLLELPVAARGIVFVVLNLMFPRMSRAVLLLLLRTTPGFVLLG